MSRIVNFSPGPAALPLPVLEQVRDELLDLHGCGMSVMEISHRGPAFSEIAERAEADLRELLGIPVNYRVLFMQGGATLQFAAVPLNIAREGARADYLLTGSWSVKAAREARRYCEVNIAADGEPSGYNAIPARDDWQLNPDAAYLHYTPNETIGGVEFHEIPDAGGVPLVADMSSTILSRPLDVARFGLIYAGAQKNIGPAGITVVIVRDDLLAHPRSGTPAVLQYGGVAEKGSMLNTPPTFAWYVAGLVFAWLKREGGLGEMGRRNERKKDKLYRYVDSAAFYSNPVDPACRSWMNVPFTLADPGLDAVFLSESAEAGLANLKGHRSVGGMRASLYNAVAEDGVDALIDFMREFERRHG